MEPTASLFSRLSTFQVMVAGVVLVLVVGNVVAWLFKPEPKTAGYLVFRCFLVIGIGAAVLYFVKPAGQEFDRFKREGLRAMATVLQVESTNVIVGHRPQVRLRLRIEEHGGPAYEVTHLDLVGLGHSVAPGRRLLAYVDRHKPDRLVIDWAGSTASSVDATPAKQNLSARLAELDRLREGGQVTQAEYDAHRQRILSDL